MESAGDLAAAIRVLSQRGWFASRSPEVRHTLATIARVRDYAAGQPLYLHTDAPTGVFGLVTGALEIAIPGADGLDLTIHQADAGFWIGDLALIAGQSRLVSVFAATQTRVVYLPQEPLQRLITADPHLYADFYALTHSNMALTLQLLGILATSASETRVALRLLHLAQGQSAACVEVRLSRTKLAELVALSSPTLQRVLHRIEARGLIELGYGRIRIVDRQGLQALCTISE